MAKTESELLPCPWCGSDEHLSIRPIGSLTADMPARPHFVACSHIDHDVVTGPTAYGRVAAIAAWNLRAANSDGWVEPVVYIQQAVLDALKADKNATGTVCSGLLKKPFGGPVPLYTHPPAKALDGIAVRALSWEWEEFRSVWKSQSIIGEYTVWTIQGYTCFKRQDWDAGKGCGTNDQEGFAAAQDDLDQIIRSALSNA